MKEKVVKDEIIHNINVGFNKKVADLTSKNEELETLRKEILKKEKKILKKQRRRAEKEVSKITEHENSDLNANEISLSAVLQHPTPVRQGPPRRPSTPPSPRTPPGLPTHSPIGSIVRQAGTLSNYFMNPQEVSQNPIKTNKNLVNSEYVKSISKISLVPSPRKIDSTVK